MTEIPLTGNITKRCELLKLLNEKEMNKNQLALNSPMSYSTITKIITEFLRAGFVEQVNSSKRENKYRITDKGREFLDCLKVN